MTNHVSSKEDWLDSLFDLIERKIPDHHLKPQFITEAKEAITARFTEAKIEQTQLILDLTKHRFATGSPFTNIENINNQMLAATNQICLTLLAQLKSSQKGKRYE